MKCVCVALISVIMMVAVVAASSIHQPITEVTEDLFQEALHSRHLLHPLLAANLTRENLRLYLTPGETVEVQESMEDVVFEKPAEDDHMMMPPNDNITPDVSAADIAAIGKLAWDIIKDNKPVTDVTADWCGAVPNGVAWNSMANWRSTVYRDAAFSVNQKNLLGLTMVSFTWAYNYNCAGTYKGVGRYLQNVRPLITINKVMWGWNLNINAAVSSAINAGSVASPVAQLQVAMRYTYGSVLNSSTRTRLLTVKGDCSATEQRI